ncbi:serine/threonine protein kinase [Pseudanabaena sp. FACHB-1277]|uniref:Serine/threonine protein kinase n=1 Tax=Pseudanabaena cinerea FACHB-1277 TaxID=2949581 RepID=A0A926UQS3_9CYAN|nr:serine/threonine-protein kinase [Pseudanabaena cinerea]MBD2149520.1 serine/threonine protein kinase [Pseudanabaena cinerea FACHB-1277]
MNAKFSPQFSKYRILGLVGRGQFGKVLCARIRETGKLVALKELENKRFPTSKLLRELRFLLSLQHENIVSCSALVHHHNYRYLVMDYCEGGTLRDLMNHSRTLSIYQCFDLIIDVLVGLEHAHAANIIHCDIKPENILLKITAQGWMAKISDFGIARLSQEIDSDGSNTGSPGYMAPERFYGQFSVSSDLYAVGIMLYELLMGKRPFSGMPTELMNAHLNSRVPIPDSLPRSLQLIITKSLEKLPKRRYTSAAEMRLELLQVMRSVDLNHIKMGQDAATCTTTAFASKSPYFAQKSMTDRVTAIAGGEKSHCYSTSDLLLYWHNLDFEQEKLVVRSEHRIEAIAFIKNLLFVITNRSIYQFVQGKPKALYQSPLPFLWAVSPHADWLAVTTGKQLEIRNLVYNRAMRLEFASRSFSCIIAFDRHLLLGIANRPDSNESRAIIISRRCNILYRLALPILVDYGIATFSSNRVLLRDAHNRKNIYLLDVKPYRLLRIPLEHEVLLMTATIWGYALTAKYEDCQLGADQKTMLIFLDLRGNNLNNLIVEGEVTAIAPIEHSLLAIAVTDKSGHRIYAINLKKLEIDLVL